MSYRNKTAKFVIKKNKSGEYYFNLVAENGETVATSEGYKTRQGAYNGINAVRRCAVGRTVEDQCGTEEVSEPEKATKEAEEERVDKANESSEVEKEQSLEDLLKFKRAELDVIATSLGLDAASFSNKTEISEAILEERNK